jgi:hypothetical protein
MRSGYFELNDPAVRAAEKPGIITIVKSLVQRS